MPKTMQYYELHAEVCKTFGHSKRLFIIDSLRKQELTASDLARITEMDISSLSQHLKMLKEKGLVRQRREGRSVFYSLAHRNIIQAYDLISEVLTKRIHDNQTIIGEK
ncbi:ArsR/SmtB family transcription factor [Acidobacteriota bacterium]